MSRLKKLGLFFILLFIFICVAIGVLILKIEYFDPYNSVNYSEMIDTEIPKNAKVLDYKDTHGGFLGDGDLYAVIQFDKNEKNSFLKNIEKNKKWKKTPLQKDLKLIIYGGELKKIACIMCMNLYLTIIFLKQKTEFIILEIDLLKIILKRQTLT